MTLKQRTKRSAFWLGGYAIALSLLVAACTTTQTQQSVILGCTGYSATLPILTNLNRQNKLTADERTVVTLVRNSVGKEICEKGDLPPTAAELVAPVVNAGVHQLQVIVGKYK